MRLTREAPAVLLGLALLAGCAGEPRPGPRKIVDLSSTITEDLPVRFWGHKALSDFGFRDSTEFRVIQRDEPLFVSNAYWELFNHGGTHVDAPNHLKRDAQGIDEVPLPSLVGPIRLLDFRQWPEDEPIPVSELRSRDIEPGEVAVLLVGYKPPRGSDELPSYAYLSRRAAEYLARIPVRAFGTDALSVESFRRMYERMGRGETGYRALAPVHHAFLTREIPVIEGLRNVEALLDVNTALFVALPLKVPGGDGSPVRAAAFVR